VGLVGYGLPNVEASNLISHLDWSYVYPNVISIGILSLGAQNIVPTLLQYLDYDTLKTQRAILFGSLLPLILYIIWETIFFGLFDGADGTKIEMRTMLGQVGGTVVSDLVEVFSFCAIGSSMAGASVSLVDFFEGGINMLSDQVSYHPRRILYLAISNHAS
jgi:tyrosine-specific transport protein